MPRGHPSADALNALSGLLAEFRTLYSQRQLWLLQVSEQGIALAHHGHCSSTTDHVKDSICWASADPKPLWPLVLRILEGMCCEDGRSFQHHVTTISLMFWLLSSNCVSSRLSRCLLPRSIGPVKHDNQNMDPHGRIRGHRPLTLITTHFCGYW